MLLWAEVLLVAAVLQYTVVGDGISRILKSVTLTPVAAAVLVLFLAGMSWPAVGLAVWTAGIVGLQDGFHDLAERRKLGAELTIVGALLLTAGTAWIIRASALQLRIVPIGSRLSANRMAAVCLVASMVLFAGRGGTHIVRGLLAKAGTLPTLEPGGGDQPIDTAEYNRGRLIGDLERFLVIVTVAVQAYPAMGFIVAAKGLIRIREFENRNFAEYFLVGTLASVIVAFVLGLLVRETILNLW